MFADRVDAGRRLGRALAPWRGEDPVVYGLPRGGVPVAAEVALALGAPLDVLLVRKIGAPGQPELALGAMAEAPDPVIVWNEDLVAEFGVSPAERAALADAERRVIDRRSVLYRGHRPAISPAGRTAIVVDDGLATGATMRAAVRALRGRGAGRVILAVPVAPAGALAAMRGEVDEMVVLEPARFFAGVGAFYDRFEQTPDEEVIAHLDRLAPRGPGSAV